MADAPSPAFELGCLWCSFHIVVNARGMRGDDLGSGFEAARLMQNHVRNAHPQHTWEEFLEHERSAAQGRAAPMSAFFFDPHGDDVALFAAYSCLAHPAPHIIVTHQTVPDGEIHTAAGILDAAVTVSENPALAVESLMELMDEPEIVYAPAVDDSGHAEHNDVGNFAIDYFGRHKVQPYATYAPRGERMRTERMVVPDAWMIGFKLRALSCFRSQIEQKSTFPWFYDLLDMREWLA